MEETEPGLFAQDTPTQPPQSPQSSCREILMDLARDKKIKHTENYIKKASEKTLEKILKDYEKKQLEKVNSQLSDILIKKFSELLERMEVIRNGDEMEKELVDNELLKKDMVNIVGYITPYLPMIGLLSGGATVGKHVFEKKVSGDE